MSESTLSSSDSFADWSWCSSTSDRSDDWRYTLEAKLVEVGISNWLFDNVGKSIEWSEGDGLGVVLSDGRCWTGAESRRLKIKR